MQKQGRRWNFLMRTPKKTVGFRPPLDLHWVQGEALVGVKGTKAPEACVFHRSLRTKFYALLKCIKYNYRLKLTLRLNEIICVVSFS